MARNRSTALWIARLAALAAMLPGTRASAAGLAVSFESEPTCPASAEIFAALRRELGAGNVTQGGEPGPSLAVRPLGDGKLEIVLSDPRRPQTRRVLQAPSGECGDLAQTVALLAAAWMRQPAERPFDLSASGTPNAAVKPQPKSGSIPKSTAGTKPPSGRDQKKATTGVPAVASTPAGATPVAVAAPPPATPPQPSGPAGRDSSNPPAPQGASAPGAASPTVTVVPGPRTPALPVTQPIAPPPESPSSAAVTTPVPEPGSEGARIRLNAAVFAAGFASPQAQERGFGGVAQLGLELSPRWAVGLAGGVDAPVSAEAAGGTVSAAGRRVGAFARYSLRTAGAARLHLAAEPFVTWISTESRGFATDDAQTLSDVGLAVSALWDQPVYGPVSLVAGASGSVRSQRDVLAVGEVGQILTLSPLRVTALVGVACNIF